MEKMSVGIVDSHPIYAEGIKAFLSRNGHFDVVATGHLTSDIGVICGQIKPDFLIAEIQMAGNPLEEILNAALKFPSTKTIVLTAARENKNLTDALASRARGYVLKDSRREDIIHALNCANNNEIYISPSISSSILSCLNKISVIKDSEKFIEVSVHEKKILELLIDGLTNKEIARYLLVSEDNVKNNLRNVMSKMSARNRIELVISAQNLRICGSSRGLAN